MSENPQVVNQGDINPDQTTSREESIFNSAYAYHVVGVQEYVYDRLPMVFIDGHSLVKVALTNSFVNCGEYMSRSGMSFSGCLELRHNELRHVRGIYYIRNSPIYSFGSRRKITRNLETMKEIILKQVLNIAKYIKLDKSLLISYDNYGVTVYDGFVKGKIIKYPISVEQGHLYVSWVPKIPVPLEYEEVTELNLYNHTIQFKMGVVKFNINTSGGEAQLVYNHHDVNVIGIAKSPDHGEKEIVLTHGSFYLFSHARPRTQRGAD